MNVVMNLQFPQNSGNVACFLSGFDNGLSAPLYFGCWPGGNFAFAITIPVPLST